MINFDFQTIKNKGKKEIDDSQNLKELDEIWQKYLGKKGEITHILRFLKDLPKEKRGDVGKEANILKKFFKEEIEKAKKELKNRFDKESTKKNFIDITIPGKKIETGHLHPLTSIRMEVEKIFESMGFSIVEGPHIETEWYNFDALNIPKDHPARDLWDTLWLKEEKKNQKLLLRTHTSPVQVRYMEKNNPPLRIIVPGRVFRHESSNVSHDIQFHQIEGLMVDKDISVADFKGITNEFLKRFFKKKIITRLRPGYFPFVEPAFEIDFQCLICGGRGCPTCRQEGWIEICPGGMVHPNVFKAAGLNPKEWQGFAFGIGFDRLVMMRYKIEDIRLLFSGDLRFLKQF